MGLAPILVEQIFDIIKELHAGGHHHPAGGAERADGPVHRRPGLCIGDRAHCHDRGGLRPAQERRRTQGVFGKLIRVGTARGGFSAKSPSRALPKSERGSCCLGGGTAAVGSKLHRKKARCKGIAARFWVYLTFQISLAYWAMVRSEENLPAPATFIRHLRLKARMSW